MFLCQEIWYAGIKLLATVYDAESAEQMVEAHNRALAAELHDRGRTHTAGEYSEKWLAGLPELLESEIDYAIESVFDSGKLAEVVKPNTKMIFLETPSNPLCKVSDIAAARTAADKCGAMLVVDNTFATPHHQNPHTLGAHLVVHSATKALGGHNDIMAGAIAGSKDLYDELWFTRQAIGTTLDAFSASLLESLRFWSWSTTNPCVITVRYGAAPRTATLSISELWNHPRCWSVASR